MLLRGTFFMMTAQVIFLLSAFAVNFGLARLLGPEVFGAYGVVMTVLVLAERLVVTGIPEVMQKFGGAKPEKMSLLIRKTRPWQMGYAVVVFALFWAAIPLVVRLLKDESLTLYLQIASFDILFFALYKYYLGIQNGLHRFSRHALVSISYSVTKMIATFLLVLCGLSLKGALMANFIGSFGGMVLGILFTRRLAPSQGELEKEDYLGFIVPNILYTLALFLFFSVDLWVVKYHLSDLLVGFYHSAQALSKVPYFFSLALSSALLPSISLATRDGDDQRVRELIHNFLRFLLLFLALMNVAYWGMPEKLVFFVVGGEYTGTPAALTILGPGFSLLTFFAVLNTILMARGHMKTVFQYTALAIGLDIVLNNVLVPKFGLVGAAVSTTLPMVLGTFLSGRKVLLDTGALIPLASFVRILGAMGAAIGFSALIGRFFSMSLGWIVIQGVLLVACYGLGLILSREVGPKDIQAFQQIFHKKG